MTFKKRPTRRIRVKLDYVVEYDRDLTECPITENEFRKYHGEELMAALMSVYRLRPGAVSVGLTITSKGLDHRKVKP